MAVTFDVSATTTCARLVTVVCVPPSGSLFPPGMSGVTCLATDSVGNTARCEFVVNVADRTPPVIVAPTQVVAHCTGPFGAVVTYDVSATDACDSTPRVFCVPSSGSVFSNGTTTVTCVAVDAAGNESRTSFPVTVSGDCDADCLSISCPRDIEVAVRAGSSRAVTFAVTATNACGGFDVPVYCQPPSGSAFPIGTTTVYCTATNSGAETRCSFHVTVLDTTPPSLKVPHVLTLPCQGFGIHAEPGASVSYLITATDNSDPSPQVTCMPPSGSWFGLGTNTVTCVATDASGNAATNSFQVVVNSGPNCEASVPVTELAPDNWGFELGLVGWIPSGSAFAYQPVVGEVMRVRRINYLKQQMDANIGGGYWQDLTYRIGFKGLKWIGTADNYAVPEGGLFDLEQADDSLTGELLSKPFVIEKPYISFLIGGTSDSADLRVELLVETDPGTPGAVHIGNVYYHVEFSATGHDRELLRRVGWGMDSFGHHVLGKHARIRIVDNSTTGHLNVDDFQFVDTHPHFQTVKIGGEAHPAVVMLDGYEYDWDSPVWGFADMHTHPMSYLGFAEAVMHGQPDGGAVDPTNIALALGDCNCLHGGYDFFNNQCGNYLRQALQFGVDSVGNNSHREGWASGQIGNNDYGRFRHWPVFTTKTHQQMWYEWIKRTYDGGLRVMVALCVNNALLGSASEGPGPLDDMTVGDNQIQALKEFVARHDDFMEIAYDPFQLRDIVRRDKLAIIIGSELDDIGNLVRDANVHVNPDAYSKQAVTNAIHHLYTNGVRYVFPVHLVNNKFGGTPIADVMLNIANRYLNGEALQVELSDPADHIRYSLPTNFDVSVIIQDHEAEIIAGGVALPLVLPLLPTLADVFGITPPGAGGIGAGLLPVALLGAVASDALPNALKAVPPDIWPINHHYPPYPIPTSARGHVNARGLTDLGRFAIREMMKRGMMIDVDHMSQKTLNAVVGLAESNPVGYPLNSGHNSFRDQAAEGAENNRTTAQMDHVRELGGLFGVGYENGTAASLVEAGIQQVHTESQVENNCAGTSKTVSQIYLHAVESMGGRNVALGTDVDGFIPGPGPRFGPNSDFASDSPWAKAEKIRNQDNGVLYTPKHGRPLVGPVFVGQGVDPDKQEGFPLPEYLDGNQNLKPTHAYTPEQRDFFSAVRIFYYLKAKLDAGWTQVQLEAELAKITSVITGEYNAGRIDKFALGLLKGVKNWQTFSEEETLGYLVYREEVLHEIIPQWLVDQAGYPPVPPRQANLYERLMSLRGVWFDYHHIFGANPPLKRCQTGPKDWDINFEGVAHYGMIPDLLQDMSNVGLETADLDPLFQSADGFAGMWTKCLQAADAINHPNLNVSVTPAVTNGVLVLDWYGEDSDRLEESDELGARANWRTCEAVIRLDNEHAHVELSPDPSMPTRFFRVRK